jgi:hypothetical protein
MSEKREPMPHYLLKCLSPELMDQHAERHENRSKQFFAEADALSKEIGKELSKRQNWDRVYISGYVESNRNIDPLPGFRRDSRTEFMVPALRSKAGKEWQAKLHAVRYDFEQLPGLPKIIFGEGFMGPFRTEKIGGTWFAWLGFPLRDMDDSNHERWLNNTGLNEVNYSIWEECKKSEFFLAREEAGL